MTLGFLSFPYLLFPARKSLPLRSSLPCRPCAIRCQVLACPRNTSVACSIAQNRWLGFKVVFASFSQLECSLHHLILLPHFARSVVDVDEETQEARVDPSHFKENPVFTDILHKVLGESFHESPALRKKANETNSGPSHNPRGSSGFCSKSLLGWLNIIDARSRYGRAVPSEDIFGYFVLFRCHYNRHLLGLLDLCCFKTARWSMGHTDPCQLIVFILTRGSLYSIPMSKVNSRRLSISTRMNS